jgi:hypothetical protein
MLRITTETPRLEHTLRLEGRLAGPWVDELARTWGEVRAEHDGGSFRVDLDGVTFVSPSGKSLLRRMHQEGARLVAFGFMARATVAEIES